MSAFFNYLRQEILRFVVFVGECACLSVRSLTRVTVGAEYL